MSDYDKKFNDQLLAMEKLYNKNMEELKSQLNKLDKMNNDIKNLDIKIEKNQWNTFVGFFVGATIGIGSVLFFLARSETIYAMS